MVGEHDPEARPPGGPAEVDLRRSERFLESIVENIPVMVFVKDAAGLRFVRVNRAEEEMLGYPRSELIGRADHDLFPPEEAEFFIAKDREVLESGRMLDIPEETVATARGHRVFHTKKIPLYDDAGRPAYLLGISEDITERLESEREVREAQFEAERANRAKTDFLSRMSHELRTPLNAILGFAQLSAIGAETPAERENAEQILTAGKHLLELIDEVLDVARIEQGQLSMAPEVVHVGDVVRESIEHVRAMASERGVVLDADAADVHDSVLVDRHRLKQILTNLLSNAINASGQGATVTVEAGESATPGRLRIEVTDTGPGIAPADVGRLFTAFERLGTWEQGAPGAGIGLALSRRLVELMQGEMGVHSEPGKGSTFWVELPTTRAVLHGYAARGLGATAEVAEADAAAGSTAGEAAAAAEEAPGGRTILYVEDNPTNLRLIERILSRRPGVRLLATAEGTEALELARRGGIDLLLLDLHLPGMGGEEIFHRLRADPTTASIPVIAISAEASQTKIDRLMAAGIHAYITKPFRVTEFLETVDSALAEGSDSLQ